MKYKMYRILEQDGVFYPQKSLEPYQLWEFFVKTTLNGSGLFRFETLQLAIDFLHEFSAKNTVKIHPYP